MAAALGVVTLSALALPAGAQSPAATLTAAFTLPDTRIGTLQNSVLPGSVANDRGMLLGGIGSDLWHGPDDAPGVFWMITDRGPNGQITVGNETRRTFPIPDFTPLILRVNTATAGTITIEQVIPIVGQSGKPVTGLSNIDKFDETPYDYAADKTFPLNPSGLDSEGIVRTSQGEFWICDEYSPSIVKVGANGKVIKRFVPETVNLTGTDYPVVKNLPGIYDKRRGNRGFEGIALSPDEKTLYVVLQSPLRNPNAASGDNSRQTRILAFDTATEKVVGEYVYQFQPVSEFNDTRPGEMKLSGVIALPNNQLLVLERTDPIAKVFRADLSKATNILGSKWDATATSPSLEAIPAGELAAAGVTAAAKSLVVDLSTVPGMKPKIEGMTVIDQNTLAVANDNDFDINTFDAQGNHIPLGSKSSIMIIALPGGFTGIPVDAPTPTSSPSPSPSATATATSTATATASPSATRSPSASATSAPKPPNTGAGVAHSNTSPGAATWLFVAGAFLAAGAATAVVVRRR